MTDKELHRLSRRELLQLLLTQAKETEELRRLSEEREEQLESLKKSYDHLKRRLDNKDEQIHDLRIALHEERSNRRIKLEEAGSIAEAALRLNGIFEMAQKAAEQYLYNIKLMHEKEEPCEEELFEGFHLETAESPESEGVNDPEPIFSEEPENWEEDMPESGPREDKPEPEMELWEDKTESAPREDKPDPEPESPGGQNIPDLELEFLEDMPELAPKKPEKRAQASKAEKQQFHGGKKQVSHNKQLKHKNRLGILWRKR